MNRVVITGIGIISCLGRGQSEILDALLNARSGLELNQDYKDNGMRCHVSGKMKFSIDEIDRKMGRFMSETSAYSFVAAEEALKDSGLSNEELQLGNFHVQIPAEEKYSSLNLAAAVLVICYEIRKAASKRNTNEKNQDTEAWDQEFATVQQVEHFYQHLEQVLIDIKFHDPENPRQLMQRMRRLFGRIRLDVMELNILRGILTNIEHSMERKKLR